MTPPKTYHYTIEIDSSIVKRINHYLHDEPRNEEECFGEDDTFVKTAVFYNGYEMDVKCCGVQFREGEVNVAWTEAVLFNEKGYEIACSVPSDEYLGDWVLYDNNGNTYIATVKERYNEHRM